VRLSSVCGACKRGRIEKKEIAAKHAFAVPTATPTSSATPTTNVRDQSFVSEEDEAKLRRRKERADAERTRRNEDRVLIASPLLRPKTHKKHRKHTMRSSRAVTEQRIGRKAESIEKCKEHAEWLREREERRITEIASRMEVCRIGDAIQRGD